MAQTKAKLALKNIMKRIEAAIDDAMSPKELRQLALEAIDIIVKRTRLGYGVSNNFGKKEKFPKLSEQYIKRRLSDKKLAATTSPKKSNITDTGQLLNSIGIFKERKGAISIGPQGTRDDGLSNSQLKIHLENRHNRYFLYVSELEFRQLVRIYRKTFGDLLRKRKLLR